MEVSKMKKTAVFVALVIILITLSLPCPSSADKSYKIHSPLGSLVTLAITSCTLKNIRVYDFDFSQSGDIFSIDAVPRGSYDSIQSISIEFHQNSDVVQSELVDIGPGKTVQTVYCPENFDQIVIDCSGY
jgi:hypothetical protein